MKNILVFETKEQLAEAAAQATIDLLRAAIDAYGSATWVLAGGSTPLASYKSIVEKHSQSLDWQKVTFALGDERIGEHTSPDNNWAAIDAVLAPLPAQRLRPNVDQTAENAAKEYEQQLTSLAKNDIGLPRFDVMWLGLGDDGHTLSLFPHHESLSPTAQLVIPVHDSPKPPRDRISMTLRALLGAENVMILASGAEKRDAIKSAIAADNSPIALAASIAQTHDGVVSWYVDASAAPN